MFGSVARGNARPDSDVDLTLEFAQDANPSLFEIGRIKEAAEAAEAAEADLGRPVDIGERSAMTPRVASSAGHGPAQGVLMPGSTEERLEDIRDAATDLRDFVESATRCLMPTAWASGL